MNTHCSDIVHVELTDTSIDFGAALKLLGRSEGGATNVFIGTTRRITDQRETEELNYEAAPDLAMFEISRIVEEACTRWTILQIVVIHRLGAVSVSEASVFIGVATPHRADSFEACRFVIDELKERAPIWKKERFVDGQSEWVKGAVPRQS